MRTHSHRLMFLVPVVALACSDQMGPAPDGGPDDSTIPDVATKDSPADVVADSPTEAATDGGTDATTDAPSDAKTDATSTDAGDASVDAGNCDGGCKTYTSYCGTCQCLALEISDPNPGCDAGFVQCFQNPCVNKTAACVNGQCVIQ